VIKHWVNGVLPLFRISAGLRFGECVAYAQTKNRTDSFLQQVFKGRWDCHPTADSGYHFVAVVRTECFD